MLIGGALIAAAILISSYHFSASISFGPNSSSAPGCSSGCDAQPGSSNSISVPGPVSNFQGV